MTEKEIKNNISKTLTLFASYHSTVDLLYQIVERQQREAYAEGKEQAYKEMFYVICELAGKEKAEMAAEKIKVTETR